MSYIAAGLVVGGAIYKGIEANQQDTKANRLKPTGYVPPSAKEAEQLAEQQANATTYAGQSADEARNSQVIAKSVGNVQRNAKSASDVINTSANIEAGLGSSMANNIAKNYQVFKNNALNRLMSAKGNIANYENLDQQQTLNYKRQLQGASMQNQFGAVNDVIGAGALMFGPGASSPYNYNPNYRWS